MKVTLCGVALTAAACLSAPLQAEEMRQLDAHEHGSALLNLVIDGQQLLLELDSPAFNLVGFEHQPRTEEQHRQLQQVLDTLQHPTGWLMLPEAAGCHLEHADVTTPLTTAGHEHEEEHHDAHEDNHEHEEVHNAHEDGHEHEEEHHAHEGEHDTAGHAEFQASYLWQCAEMAELDELGITLLDRYPNLKTLHLQALTPRGNLATELTAGTKRIRF